MLLRAGSYIFSSGQLHCSNSLRSYELLSIEHKQIKILGLFEGFKLQRQFFAF